MGLGNADVKPVELLTKSGNAFPHPSHLNFYPLHGPWLAHGYHARDMTRAPGMAKAARYPLYVRANGWG